MEIGRVLVTLGVVLVVAGLLWPWLSKLGLGRLPGDIVIERETMRVYIPIVTSLVISVVLSAILWFLGR
ncbi:MULTISPECIES: DUF2905 domain-containing protein [unclassified Roseitalea]|uniref:DUF2905 domain-containing protein n=1 Tax=unclassified Roseitalea TaxID=2639107 RepID=UPI00320971A5